MPIGIAAGVALLTVGAGLALAIPVLAPPAALLGMMVGWGAVVEQDRVAATASRPQHATVPPGAW